MSNDQGTLMQMLVDGLAELRAGMAELSKQQATHALQVERSIREMGDKFASEDDHEKLAVRVEKLEGTVGTHNRVVWILGVIGGVCLAVATAVITNGVQAWIDAPRQTNQAAPAKAPNKE